MMTDGRLVLHALPHPNSPSALTVALIDGSISAVKLRKGEIKVSEYVQSSFRLMLLLDPCSLTTK